MVRRLALVVCSTWITLTSLIPGQGWNLCVSPSGHVAVEVMADNLPRPFPDRSSCRENCGEEKCEACHDVELTSAERACSRRDVVAVELVGEPVGLVTAIEPRAAHSTEPSPATTPRALPSPHLLRVLRI